MGYGLTPDRVGGFKTCWKCAGGLSVTNLLVESVDGKFW